MSNKKQGAETANKSSESDSQDSGFSAIVIGKDEWENTQYGDIEVLLLGFPDRHGNVREGSILVRAKEPHGMAMTEWRHRIVNTIPTKLPLLIQ